MTPLRPSKTASAIEARISAILLEVEPLLRIEHCEAVPECSQIDPDLREVAPGHTVACIRVPGWFDAPTSA
jgi:hypothetical protein